MEVCRFVSGKGCESQGSEKGDSNSFIFEKAARMAESQNAVSLMSYNSQNFQNFRRKIPICRETLLLSLADFQKRGVFQGVVMKNFRGASPGLPFCSLCSHLVSAPPPHMNFFPTGLLSKPPMVT